MFNDAPRDANLTHTLFAPEPNAATLFCVDQQAARKVEGMRALFCLPPLDPARPTCTKAYLNSHNNNNNNINNQEDRVIESRMFMGDALLTLMHKACAGEYPHQFHTSWHGALRNGGVVVRDDVVPLSNIVKPVAQTIFPVIDSDEDDEEQQRQQQQIEAGGGAAAEEVSPARHRAGGAGGGGFSPPGHATPGRAPALMRHATAIAPSAGHVDGDYSIGTFDRAIPSMQQKSARSPQRLRITQDPNDSAPLPPREEEVVGEDGVVVVRDLEPSPVRSSRAVLSNRTLVSGTAAGGGGGAASTASVVQEQQQQRQQLIGDTGIPSLQAQQAAAEAERRNPKPLLYRWNLSIVHASADYAHGPAIAFAASPLTATAVHRCSVQILARANDPAVPAGTTALANGVFERPSAIFGLAHRSVLSGASSSSSASGANNPQQLWCGLQWSSSVSSTLPGAAMMVGTTSTGKPICELPQMGKHSQNDDHFVRIGDVLTIETRPAPRAARGGGRFSLDPGVPPPPVSVHFFINNVEVHSFTNLATMQPYCRARRVNNNNGNNNQQQQQQEQHAGDVSQRMDFDIETMYFAVRLSPGTEIAIVSGDPERVVGTA